MLQSALYGCLLQRKKLSIFRIAGSRVAGQRCLLVWHAQPTPFSGRGLSWYTAVQGGATRVLAAIFENKKLRQIGTAQWCVLVSEIVAARQRIQIILRLIRF